MAKRTDTLFPRDFGFPATPNLLIFPDSSQSVHCGATAIRMVNLTVQ